MRPGQFAAVVLLTLGLSAEAAAPMDFDEIAVLLRVGVPEPYLVEKVARRRLLHALTAEEEQKLTALGASPGLLQSLRSPKLILDKAEAAGIEIAREKEKTARADAAAAEAAARPRALAKEDFETFDVQFGRPVNLSHWGGPAYEIRFFVKKAQIEGDQVLVLMEDTTRTFTENAVSAGSGVGVNGPYASAAATSSSYSPKQFLPLNRSTSLAVPGVGTLYPVYEAGGVALYFQNVSVRAADSVTLAVRVTKH